MMPPLVVLLFISYLFSPTPVLSQVSSEFVCDPSFLFHGEAIEPAMVASPFNVTTSSSEVGQGEILFVEIKSDGSELKFGEFVLYARVKTPPYAVVGRFATSNDTKLINCNGVDTMATHVNKSFKNNFRLQWQAPNVFLGEVVFVFYATIDTYWVQTESTPVQVVQKDYVNPQSTDVSTTALVHGLEVKDEQRNTYNIYDGCGKTKTCFGFPDNCIDHHSCLAIATVVLVDERYQFEMKSSANDVAYVAIGISMDDRMADDSCMECIVDGDTIRMYSSWNTPPNTFSSTREGVPQDNIRLLSSSFEDGTIYCKLDRDAQTTVFEHEFDLDENEYHLMVASGRNLRAASVGNHNIGRIVSSEPLDFGAIVFVRGRSTLLLRLHAAFMLTAWIGAASIGILLARYFKQTWVGSSLCGKDQWFAWHRFFMITTWALTIAGFVIIFVEIGGWSAEDNPHAILGTITTALCFIQPFMALFRPAPTHKNRPIFNWAHLLVGNVAYTLAIVTTFFAVELTGAQLPQWFYWILTAFVGFYVVLHLIFSIADYMSERSSSQRFKQFPLKMASLQISIDDSKKDAQYSGLRKGLLAIYILFVTAFTVAMVVVAVLVRPYW